MQLVPNMDVLPFCLTRPDWSSHVFRQQDVKRCLGNYVVLLLDLLEDDVEAGLDGLDLKIKGLPPTMETTVPICMLVMAMWVGCPCLRVVDS